MRSRTWRRVLVVLAGAVPANAGAQQPIPVQSTMAMPLIFEGVTVVDVEHGALTPNRRVVVAGNRIIAVTAGGGAVPKGARVVDARGKYLIPGLWDVHMHVHLWPRVIYPLLVANGITGIRDPGSEVALDTLRRWRQNVLDGVWVGPPRQIISGKLFESADGPYCRGSTRRSTVFDWSTKHEWNESPDASLACVADAVDVQHVVDSLAAAGVDMIKIHGVDRKMYFMVAAAARHRGIPFGGHMGHGTGGRWWAVTGPEASDSGARIVDHDLGLGECRIPTDSSFDGLVPNRSDPAAQEQCWKAVAERYRRNDTWFVPTIIHVHGWHESHRIDSIFLALGHYGAQFWRGALPSGNWLHDDVPPADSNGLLRAARRAGLPLLAGTDGGMTMVDRRDNLLGTEPPGFTLHVELAIFVMEGLTPLEALQTATLNPAKMWHATDSLGTVAPGKLADLVLLDANPLDDITNTTAIRAVVANGRYFDRAALDRLLASVPVARDEDWRQRGWGASAPRPKVYGLDGGEIENP